MSGYELCRVCGKTAYLEHSGPGLWGRQNRPKTWKHYCSKLCNNSDNWKIIKYTAYGFFIVAGMFYLTEPKFLPFALLFAITGLIFFIIGNSQRDYVKKGGSKPKKSRARKSTSRRRSDGVTEPTLTPIGTKFAPITDEPQDQLVYSDILQEEVLNCCYQTARLNDKYCICGRALEYPSTQ